MPPIQNFFSYIIKEHQYGIEKASDKKQEVAKGSDRRTSGEDGGGDGDDDAAEEEEEPAEAEGEPAEATEGE